MFQQNRVLKKTYFLALSSLLVVCLSLLPRLFQGQVRAQDQPCSSWRKGNLDLINIVPQKYKIPLPVRSVAFSPNGSFLAVGSAHKLVEIWEVAKINNKKPLMTFEPLSDQIITVAFSPDGELLASGGLDGVVTIWNWKKKQVVGMFRDHSKSVWSTLFSPDGQFLISASLDKTVKIWNLKTGNKSHEWSEKYGVERLALSPNGETLAVSLAGGFVELRNWKTGELIRPFGKYKTSVSNLTFSPDGQMLVFSPYSFGGGNPPEGLTSKYEPNEICFWDLQGEQLGKCLKGHQDTVSALSFSPDGQCLISGSWDDTVKVWRVADRTLVYDSPENSKRILSLAFSPDGRSFVRSSGDGSFKILRYKQ